MTANSDPTNEPTIVRPTQDMADVPTLPEDELPTMAYSERRSAAEALPFQRDFGDYELIQELGRGGMGVVYKARQKGLDRIVAVKMVLPGPLSNSDELIRFKTEAEAAARLQHPNIVRVHEIHEFGGQHFYSMDFIDGPSLSQRLAGGPLLGKVAARYVMISARAIHHAHRLNILHRDLKPSNILLDANDEPHITDFGLAKKLGGDSGQTHTGAILGTPSYMAPEQAAGRIKELGPACDVYGLGAVLYELITGRPIFHADSPLDTIQQVLEQEPIPPRHLIPQIDKDLETICLKCVQKDPLERYASAEALADDLNRYLNGESINARSLNVLDRLHRTLDRSRLDAEFHGSARMLEIIAIILFVGHAVMFVLLYTHARDGRPHPIHTTLHWVTRLTQFGLIFLTFWYYRWRQVMRTSAAERQLWTIWVGYMMAYVINVLVVRELAGEHWDELTVYPFAAVLAGMGFFAMGSSYWGKCYLFGLAFYFLAALMPWKWEWRWAPLGLGALWAVTLVLIAQHLRRLGGEVAQKKPEP